MYKESLCEETPGEPYGEEHVTYNGLFTDVTGPWTSETRSRCMEKLSSYFKGLEIDRDEFVDVIEVGLCDEMTVEEFTEYSSQAAESLSTKHPHYGILSVRIVLGGLYDRTFGRFSERMRYIKMNSDVLCDEFYDIIMDNKNFFDGLIVSDGDDWSYFGIMTLMKSYLLSVNNRVAERPQDMFLRVAIQLNKRNLEDVRETYEYLSRRLFTFGSPAFFNSGSSMSQMASCFLVDPEEDTVEGHFETLKKCAVVSQEGGGIGINFHNVRAKGSPLFRVGGEAKGIVPLAQVYNWTLKYIGHGSKRTGRVAIYLEPWHRDILSFLDLRKSTGKEELRARDVFTALWIPDLFMERVEKDEAWSLFCPNDAPGLCEVWGDEFRELYCRYEKSARRDVVPAQKIWKAIIESQIETGTPYMMYKDTCNRLSNHQHIGTIKSSNLCAEIVEYSGCGEIAVCNIASVCLPKFVHNGAFDFDMLRSVIRVLVKDLNKMIDVTRYPVENAKVSNMRHRPIGIGVQGLADTFIMMGLPFESPGARSLNKEIFESLYYSALESSCELAKKFGKYSTFDGSLLSKGVFHFEAFGAGVSGRWDWESLRSDIVRYGSRNSLLIAVMPTASTSQIFGNNECIEPYTSNVYTRRTLAGEFKVVNRHLVKDLFKLNLWSPKMKDLIIDHDGSIQKIPTIPQSMKDLYKTAWEIKMKSVIDMAKDRQAFIDHSQSLNIFIARPSYSQISSMHFYGFRAGLKTGMYYLRTRPITAPIKFSLDPKSMEDARREILGNSGQKDAPEGCDHCSA